MREQMAFYANLTPEEHAAMERERDRAIAERAERYRVEDAAAKQRQLLRVLQESVGKRYHDCTFDNYELYDPRQKPVVGQLRDIAAGVSEWTRAGRGLILYGPSGTGKDHLATALMLHAARECRIPCIALQARTFPFLPFEEARLIIDHYSRWELAVVTVIDPGASTEFQTRLLGNLLDIRYRRQLSTWLTVNCRTKEDGQTLLGTAIFDRFLHDAITFYCDWPSFRERTVRRPARPGVPAGGGGGG